MSELIKAKKTFVVQEVSADEARQIFKDQPYKLELIDGLEHGDLDDDGNPTEEKLIISIYTNGNFTDLCRGPHVESHRAESIPEAIKLLNVAGAYWRGDEKRPMLQRIYGTAWEQPKTAQRLPLEAGRSQKTRPSQDRQGTGPVQYRIDEVGAGLILWHPKVA